MPSLKSLTSKVLVRKTLGFLDEWIFSLWNDV